MIPLAALLLAAALSGAAGPAPSDEVRVFDTRLGVIASSEAVFDAAARADVVFVGEVHGDRGGHRFQLRLLEGLAERGRPVVLVMEMFERDVQPHIDAYLAGRIDEARFLQLVRPWSNYREDYRPQVELARRQGWPVVAGNAPRPLAARIARQGQAALEAMTTAERLQVASDLRCRSGAYRDKFMAEMTGMVGRGHGSQGAPVNLDRLFLSQCAKDETMAESAARRLTPGATVVHLNGAFHSDERLGAVERLLRRRPQARALVISMTPGGSPRPSRGALGDFVVWTPGGAEAR